MKKLVQETEGEGLVKLLGETVIVMCMNYFYNGKLVGVNDTCILLHDPKLFTKQENGPTAPGRTFKAWVWMSCIFRRRLSKQLGRQSNERA